jgi:hypothetical protein
LGALDHKGRAISAKVLDLICDEMRDVGMHSRLIAWRKALATLGGIHGVGAGCLRLDIDSLIIVNGKVDELFDGSTSYK